MRRKSRNPVMRRIIVAALAAPLGDVAWAEAASLAERLEAASGRIEQADSMARQADEKIRFGFTATACSLVEAARVRYSMAAMDLIALKQEAGDAGEDVRLRIEERLSAANGNVVYASTVIERDCVQEDGHGHDY
jgi:hypothetical protein